MLSRQVFPFSLFVLLFHCLGPGIQLFEVSHLYRRGYGGIGLPADILVQAVEPVDLPAEHNGECGDDGYRNDLKGIFHLNGSKS